MVARLEGIFFRVFRIDKKCIVDILFSKVNPQQYYKAYLFHDTFQWWGMEFDTNVLKFSEFPF